MKNEWKIIDKLEEKNKIPEKLAPKSIKSMLDEMAILKPVIEEDMPKIKLSSNRLNFFKTVGIVAALMLIVGGVTFIKINTDNKPVVKIETSPAEIADTTELTGLRGASYKALFNFVNQNYAQYSVVDCGYMLQNEVIKDKKEISRQYRYYSYDGGSVMNFENFYLNTGNESDEYVKSLQENMFTVGDLLLYTSSTDVTAFVMQGSDTKKLEYDFWQDSYVKNGLVDTESLNPNGKFDCYIVRAYVCENYFVTLFDFYLPKSVNGETEFIDYCGMCVYDISDSNNISLVYECEQPGSVRSVNLDNDKLIIISDYMYCKRLLEGQNTFDGQNLDFIPALYENGERKNIPEKDIYLANQSESSSLMVITGFELSEKVTLNSQKLLGVDTSYCTNMWGEGYIFLSCYYENGKYGTQLILISTDDKNLEVKATKYFQNRLSVMDFSCWEDKIALAVNNLSKGTSCIYVLDKELESSEIYDTDNFYAPDLEDYGSIGSRPVTVVLEGSKAYECYEVSDNNSENNYQYESEKFINYRVLDLTTGNYSQIDDSGIVAGYSSNLVKVSDDVGVNLTTEYDEQGDEIKADRVLNVYSTDTKENVMLTGEIALFDEDSILGYSDPEYVSFEYKGLKKLMNFTLTSPVYDELYQRELSKVSQGTKFEILSWADDFNEFGSCTADIERGLVFIPKVYTVSYQSLLSENLTSSSDMFTDGENWYVESYGEQVSALAVAQYDKQSGEFTQLGEVKLYTGFADKNDLYTSYYEGTKVYKDNIYTIDNGVLFCYSLNDLSVPLYAEEN